MHGAGHRWWLLLSILAGLLFTTALFLWSEWRSPKLLTGQLSIWPPEAPEARRWLQLFHEHEQQRAGPVWLSQMQAGQAASPTVAAAGPASPQRHKYLVVAAVGDRWKPRWLSQPGATTFDLALLYYGNTTNFTCALCSDVLRIRGPKWYLHYNLTTTPVWSDMLARGYEYIMFPDDDLEMDTGQLNTFFRILTEFQVLLAQPSLCRGNNSYTCWEELYQNPEYRLRYTNFVEIMAPAIRMDFFQHVLRFTLSETYTGYGLDFVWPALLNWPHDKVAVVDEVCMIHPPSPPGGKPGGLYQITSMFTKESEFDEQKRTINKYNYWQPVVWRNGMPWKTPVVFGGVLKSGMLNSHKSGGAAPSSPKPSPTYDSLPGGLLLLVAAALVVPVALKTRAWHRIHMWVRWWYRMLTAPDK